jgi:short-subunit dehydrogenase
MPRTVVAITGASSGIGSVFAQKLASGHDLILIARRRDRLENLAEQLGRIHGSNVEVIQADLTKPEDLDRVAERVGNEPRLALLVNNAGFGAKGRFWESPLETQEQMHRLHVMAPMQLCHAALRNMVKRDFGGIINVASVSAFVRSPAHASYAATKSWMTVFTESLYLELKSVHSNVTVQALCPGFTYSEFHDTMGADRKSMASSAYWMTADQVVEASLDGLRRRKLFVIPGWRYRLFTAIFSKLPSALRLALEAKAPQARAKEITSGVGEIKRIEQ